jgi:hypothetical protein
MSEDRSDAASGKGVLRWFIVPVVLVLLYVLSIGPAAWLNGRGLISEPRALYSPVVSLGIYWTPFFTFLNWYVEGVWRSNIPGVRA